jgi:prephenate dehydratase
MRNVAFLGPRGTFTEVAASGFFAEVDVEFVPFASIAQVLDAVQEGLADHAVVPLENSIEGSVTMTMDWLIHQVDLKLQAELTLPIAQHLFAATRKELQEIRKIFSHPQAISQCRLFLHEHLPNAELEYTASTADAVKRVTSEPDQQWAAIGPDVAGSLYQAERLQSNIQDHENNSTRFVLVGKTTLPALKVSSVAKYKTTLVVELPSDFPGALHQVLAAFAWRGINLTKIESRPTKKRLGSYLFILDVERDQEDVLLTGAVAEIEALGCDVHSFGSYPVYLHQEIKNSSEKGERSHDRV